MTPAIHPRRAVLLLAIFTLNFIEFLQAGMIAFGAGPIMGGIGASPEEFSLATAVYACVAIGVIARQRWLVERVGWRRFIAGSVICFICGAAICAGSGDFPQFLLGRAIMGLGAAAFMTSARLMINLMPPGPQRLVGIRAFACALAGGSACAPWLASLAVAHDSWPAMFAVLALLAVTAAALGWFCLPGEPAPHHLRTGSHALLTMLMAGGSFACLYALQRAAYDFYGNAPLLLVLLSGGVCALVWFAYHQRRHPLPLLAISRLLHPRYLSGLALFTLCYIILGANNSMLPVLMQRALGQPWQVIGQVQALGMLSSLATILVMLRIIPKSPAPRKFYVAGFGALCFFGWQLSRLSAEANLWTDVLPAIAAYGMFIMLAMATTALQTFTQIQGDEVAFANGQQLKNMLSQFGVALGIAAATLNLQWHTSVHYSVLSQRFTSGDTELTRLLEQLSGALTPALGAQQAGQAALGQLSQLLNQQATLLASLNYFSFIMVVAAVCAVMMWFQRVFR